MAWAPLIAAVGFALLAAASFFFALAETALFTLGKWRVRQLAERDPEAGGRVARLLAAPQDCLATIVLGNTFANAGLVAIGLWLVAWKGFPAPLTLAGVLALILVGAEVVPKTLAVRVPQAWAVRVARPMLVLLAVTGPLRQVAQRLNTRILQVLAPRSIRPATVATEEDYAELIELAFQQGTLAQAEKEIILQIVSLDRRTAKEVMRPRAGLVCLPDDLPVTEMIAAARQLRHRRLPLYDGTPDTIVGVLNTRALLLDPTIDLAEVIEFPSFVPASMNLLQLLKSLQRQQRGLAIVLDEFGSTAGVVTTEDILGVVVGTIRGEDEAEGFVMETLGPGWWRVNGTMRLDDFRRAYPLLADMPEVETMGGLLVALAEVVPVQGASVVFGNLQLTAKIVDERRVRELWVEVRKKGEAPA